MTGTARAATNGRKYQHYNVTRHKYNSDDDVCCPTVTQETAVGKTIADYQCCATYYVHYAQGERCCVSNTTVHYTESHNETNRSNIHNATTDANGTVDASLPDLVPAGSTDRVAYVIHEAGVFWKDDTYRQIIGHKGAGLIYAKWQAHT